MISLGIKKKGKRMDGSIWSNEGGDNVREMKGKAKEEREG